MAVQPSEARRRCMLLYKYRSLADWKFVLDIIAHRRLYSASFLDLNDPMEGYYEYATDRETSHEYERFAETIEAARSGWRICSLSENERSTLMWSYYANGHTGVVIGVEPPRQSHGRRLERVMYDNTITVAQSDEPPEDIAVRILSQKLYSWSHEREQRVFSPTLTPFIPVTIRELLIGCRASRDDENLLRSVTEVLAPDVEIRRLKASELEPDY
jgi:hypothetical protein